MAQNMSSILTQFNKFTELLLQNKFFGETSFNNLTFNIEGNEKKLELIISDIEKRSTDEVNRFSKLLSEFGLVEDESIGAEAERDSLGQADELRLLTVRINDIISSPKVLTENLVVVKADRIQSTKSDDVYNMTANPRGICLIIDNQLFSDPLLPFRYGSRADSERLSNVFSQLSFDVQIKRNQTVSEMEKLFLDLSKNSDLKYHNALAVIILSHGKTDSIYGSDGNTIKIESVLKNFNNINCLSMIDKPKMFFISACRGRQTDCGVEHFVLETREELSISDQPIHALGPGSSTSFNIRSKRMPTWSDFFIFYSSVTGYASLRDRRTGTWFGYELAHGLAKYAHNTPLYDLVAHRVNEALQQRVAETDGENWMQAIESNTRGLVKKLYFNPGF